MFCLPLCAFGHGILHLCISYNIFCMYVHAGIYLYTECMQLICCSHKRGIPTETTNQNGVPQNLSCVAVLLHCARDYRWQTHTALFLPCMSHPSGHVQYILMFCLYKAMLIFHLQVQWSSLRPTQLPLMCVELATSPSGVSMMVWRVWYL